MEDSEIIIEAIKEHLLKPCDDGFDKESVDLAYQGHMFEYGKSREVIMVEGKCKLFGSYKTWIEIDKYKQLARDYKLRNLI